MIPMCWKCSNIITEQSESGNALVLIGCSECDKITDYNSARMFCPLLKIKKTSAEIRKIRFAQSLAEQEFLWEGR